MDSSLQRQCALIMQSCGPGLFIFTKKEHCRYKARVTGELYREYGGTSREAVKMGGMEHFIDSIHFKVVEKQSPLLTCLLTSSSFYAALEVCFKL